MFGLSKATELFQGSTVRTWNFVLRFTNLFCSKLNPFGKSIMPKSRKRHHSRSRSKSRSHSRDRSHDREDKYKKIDVYEKDRDGKRRRVDSSDSPHKRSVSCAPECPISNKKIDGGSAASPEECSKNISSTKIDNAEDKNLSEMGVSNCDKNLKSELSDAKAGNEVEEISQNESDSSPKKEDNLNDAVDVTNSDDSLLELSTTESVKEKLVITPKKILSPKQVQKKLESEKKRQEREREKIKKKEEKQRELEQKQKEKEMKETQRREEKEKKEEQKRKEREEKEQKRKEKEEREEQKRKEREQERIKKLQEIEEKNREKQKEEEKKQKAAAAFVNFFVSKKTDTVQEKKLEVPNTSIFKAFEVKSDMRLPPLRRNPLSPEEQRSLDTHLCQQIEHICYLSELKNGKVFGKSGKTWPYQDTSDEDVIIVEEGINLGETICEDNSKVQKFRAKFLKFHENRRPPYYGTWRKKSKFVTARKPFAEDIDMFNYEEDSDDDWEDEEQGESLNGSDDEEKENDEEKDEYEVDNEFFVPHGHLSDDEIDDEEKAKLSPESLKQKLKLLKDEFELDMQSKTHKLKSRSIGCIWYNKNGSNIDEAINRYLQPLAIVANIPIKIKKRTEMLVASNIRKNKPLKELNPEYIPSFLKVIHGNSNKKAVLIEQFQTYMANQGIKIDLHKAALIRTLKQYATWKLSSGTGKLKNRLCWLVHENIAKQFNMELVLPNFLDTDQKK